MHVILTKHTLIAFGPARPKSNPNTSTILNDFRAKATDAIDDRLFLDRLRRHGVEAATVQSVTLTASVRPTFDRPLFRGDLGNRNYY